MTEKKLGKYTLIRQIAQGGMAEIWLAEQRGPGGFNKELVIKRILPHLAAEGQMTQMFMDEARMVAYLTHPNIGQVFELGEQGGDYYIAMEFIDGLDLAQLCDRIQERGVRLPVAYAARIIRDILMALDYAHEFIDRDGNHVGLIHRDISPHNVLISNEGVVKLVDFGVAKAALNSHKTETGAVKGKFAYMAPEQIESKTLDRRVDIFAVGCVFYEILTGSKPFGDDLQAVSKILAGDVVDPRQLRDDIPEEAVQIILRALSTDREERYASAAEMERALEQFLRNEQVHVGTREISVMVRQLRGLPVSRPTEQLFGFEMHGVQRNSPRITARDGNTQSAWGQGGADTVSEVRSEQKSASAGSSAVQASETPADPDRRPPGRSTLALKVESEGMSLKLVFTFVAVMFALVAAAGVTAYIFISKTDDSAVQQSDATPTGEAAGEAAQERTVAWRHSDGLVVFIGAEEVLELYRDGEKVGETPFQTALRPGTYSVELRRGGKRKTETFEVEEGRPIQRYRFEL